MTDVDFTDPTVFAHNDQDALDTFENRRAYQSSAFPKGGPKAFDFWDEVPYYGRIDHRNRVVYVSETNLAPIPTRDGTTLFVIDFVAAAFKDLREYIAKARARRVLNENGGSILQLEPKRAWVSPEQQHHEHMTDLYDILVSQVFRAGGFDKQIKSFEGFLKIFDYFVDTQAQNVPITRSAFMMSRYCDARSSGLIIDLAAEPHSVDIIKRRRYIEDPNFGFFHQAARRFGFRLDKNAPWRLIADISSNEMGMYMGKFGLASIGDFFETYHYKAYERDLDLLKAYLMQIYNSYVEAYPEVSIHNGICTRVFKRPLITMATLMRISDIRWAKTYLFLRAREVNHIWDYATRTKHLKKVQALVKHVDLHAALRYTNTIARSRS